MTTTPTLHRRSTLPVAVRPTCSLDDVEAWMGEVGPVLRSLTSASSGSSLGRQRWLAEVVRHAADALCFLDGECAEAEALGHPGDAVAWAHTRVAALLARAEALLAVPAAA